ncbi:MAG: biotin/lipoyl-containing protein [Bacillota bacterium]
MATEFLLPRLGETMEEGIISEWLKHPGDRIERGEPLLVVETDKATVEVPSFVAGIVLKTLKEEGEVVSVGTAIAVIEEDA